MGVALAYGSVNELVESCKKGHAPSYRALYDKYCKAMYNTSLRIVQNQMDAEDVCQEAFVEAFRKLNQFEGRSTFGAWLKKIVVNRSLDALKKRKIKLTEWDDQMNDSAEEWSNSEDVKIFNLAKIKQAMMALSDGYRTVLTLYLIEGYDHKEIAGILGVKESTIRTQYKRGKDRLLKIMKVIA